MRTKQDVLNGFVYPSQKISSLDDGKLFVEVDTDGYIKLPTCFESTTICILVQYDYTYGFLCKRDLKMADDLHVADLYEAVNMGNDVSVDEIAIVPIGRAVDPVTVWIRPSCTPTFETCNSLLNFVLSEERNAKLLDLLTKAGSDNQKLTSRVAKLEEELAVARAIRRNRV